METKADKTHNRILCSKLPTCFVKAAVSGITGGGKKSIITFHYCNSAQVWGSTGLCFQALQILLMGDFGQSLFTPAQVSSLK